jgi:PKD repeat protein
MNMKRSIKEELKIKYQHANTFRIMLLCLIVLFLGLMSASVTHAESYKFVTKWGSSGNGAGQFNGPLDVALDSKGNVYVADWSNNRVQEFNSNGKFINQWGSTNDISLSRVSEVAVDSSGNIYVEDYYNNRIVKFDKNGNVIAKFGSYGSGNGQFNNMQGFCLDSSGNIYVADCGNNRIQKFDSNGNYLMQWGSYGISNGQFNTPIDVTSHSDNIYVADNRNHRIQKFDSNGNYLMQFGNSGNGDGQFNFIEDIAVDTSDNIYVTDSGNTRIQKFDSDGNYLTQWGSWGTDDGQFKYIEGADVDSSGYVYVADSGNNRIQKFAPVYQPVTNFVSNVTTGYAPLTVKFTDTSTGTPFSWTWNFGDGTSSTVKNPTHTYSKAGKYTVKLTATNEGGNSTATKTNYITVKTTTVKPVAAFSASPTSGKAPLTVKFTDKSTGSPAKWKWTFGDGATSIKQNPTHKYSTAGKYKVTLTVTNTAGSNTITKTNYITVVAKPVAAFSALPTSGKLPLNVKFTDTSTGTPTKWKWTFGDGATSSKQNPVHKYSKAGSYTVKLTVTNAAGSNTKTISSYITVKIN